jgi:hypothetical protein
MAYRCNGTRTACGLWAGKLGEALLIVKVFNDTAATVRSQGSSWEWEGVVLWPRAAELKGGGGLGLKIKVLDEKMDFLLSKNFKLLNRM